MKKGLRKNGCKKSRDTVPFNWRKNLLMKHYRKRTTELDSVVPMPQLIWVVNDTVQIFATANISATLQLYSKLQTGFDHGKTMVKNLVKLSLQVRQNIVYFLRGTVSRVCVPL